MAMTLRLTKAETEVLRRRPDLERRSMQEVVRQAIREYVEATAALNCTIGHAPAMPGPKILPSVPRPVHFNLTHSS